MSFTETLQGLTGKPLADCTNQELYLALLELVRQKSADRVQPVTGRKLYYISAEFLIGKLLSNNLINLGLYDEARDALAAAGKSLSDIEEVEPEPSLGNGGLGRLAACFLDSLATLNLPGDGVGLRYHFGLFHQSFEDGVQNEKPDPWLTAHSWAEKTDITYPVELAGKEYTARLYKLAVTGYEGRTNTLNLFDLDTIDESIVHDGIAFDKTAIDKNLTLFLYPDDSDEAGRRLRVYQQYLMVSAGAQLILAECAARGCDYHDLADYAAIQINDTHPSMVIPELIRLLGEKGIEFEEAVKIVTKTCAYTNHTILAEALEKWPRAYLDAVVPQLMPIIEKLDALARTRTKDESLAIIDKDDRVHMAHMDIHFTHSTNGVAALHTEILKNSELHGFYELYPEKFNNKTNGITFRRWLMACNPELSAQITDLLGDEGWITDLSRLKELEKYAGDPAQLDRFSRIKSAKKATLAEYIAEHDRTAVDADSIFDIQIKRLHEYKRQLLNAFSIMYIYFGIKDGSIKDFYPTTFIFGAKSAPGYARAKAIIKYINEIAALVNSDPAVKGLINVVFVQNYNVSYAEKLVTAADISEQISTAGTEASGTGNMKFMLNGTVTLGTYDGANVEIAEEAGIENNYIFGARVEELEKIMPSYDPRKIYASDPQIARVLDTLIDGTFSDGGSGAFRELYYALLDGASWHVPDHYYLLGDLHSYVEAKLKANADYRDDRAGFLRKCWINMSNAGKFSSDRTIADYAKEIWRITPDK